MDVTDWEDAGGSTAAKPEVCAKDLRKYFYVIAAAGVMILSGTYWYQNYYSDGGVAGQSRGAATQPSVGAAGLPMVQGSPVVNIPAMAMGVPGAELEAPAAAAQAVNWLQPFDGMGLPAGGPKARGDFAKIVNSVRYAVVNVTVAKNTGTVKGATGAALTPQDPAPADGVVRFADPLAARALESVGSGVIVRNDGYILTNYHVVRGANNVLVTVFNEFGSERYAAEVVKMDEAIDLALLKIKPKAPLAVAVLGDSGRINVADDVIAIGSPFGLDHTVSRGIVSSIGKSLVIEGVNHRDLIQTDAAINQGNSGGPLIHRNGTVIGINTAIYTPTGAFSGVGFAVPSNQARMFILEEINRLPKARAAAFGQPAPASPAGGAVGTAGPPILAGAKTPHTDGREKIACVTCHTILTKGVGASASPVALQPSAAAQAGPAILAGARSPHKDGREKMACVTCHTILTKGGAAAAATPVAMQNQFAGPPGTLARNVAAPTAGGQEPGFAILGAEVRAIDPALATTLKHQAGHGVFVASVVPESPAAKAGVRPGDIILKIDGRRVQTAREAAASVAAAGNGNTARLAVERDGRRLRLDLGVAVFAPPGAATPGATPGMGAGAAGRTPAVPTEFNWLGMEIESFVPATTQPGSPMQGLKGAQIAEVIPGSEADRAGLAANDVILEIDRQPVATAAQMDLVVRTASKKGAKVFRVARNDRDFYVIVE
ncbi:MAG: trypsin-like peptidase domain-containing protein [Magnetospirillum sp. WYHS-4]